MFWGSIADHWWCQAWYHLRHGWYIAHVIETTADIQNIAQKTINWYVLGRVQPAYDSFKDGLRTLGFLESMLKYPNVFRVAFCSTPETLTASSVESIFTVKSESEGSKRDWLKT